MCISQKVQILEEQCRKLNLIKNLILRNELQQQEEPSRENSLIHLPFVTLQTMHGNLDDVQMQTNKSYTQLLVEGPTLHLDGDLDMLLK